MKETFIKSIGYYVPKGRISNEKIMELFKEVNADWISDEQFESIYNDNNKRFKFLGIKTRSICKDLQNENAVSNAVKACKNALDKAQFNAEELECLIMTGLSNPFREPTFANVVAKELGVKHADFFDINDTCNGFLKSVEIADLYIKIGKCKNVLVCACENPYEFGYLGPGFGEDFVLDDFNDMIYKFSIFIIGSGAGAILLGSDSEGSRLKHYAEWRETQTWDVSWYTLPYLTTPPTIYGKKIRGYFTDARRIASGVLKKVPEFVKLKLREWNIEISDIDYVISHQLGNNITLGILEQLNIDQTKAPINTFGEFGNMATANIPINLEMANEKGIFKSGDQILILGCGAGLSILIALLEW